MRWSFLANENKKKKKSDCRAESQLFVNLSCSAFFFFIVLLRQTKNRSSPRSASQPSVLLRPRSPSLWTHGLPDGETHRQGRAWHFKADQQVQYKPNWKHKAGADEHTTTAIIHRVLPIICTLHICSFYDQNCGDFVSSRGGLEPFPSSYSHIIHSQRSSLLLFHFMQQGCFLSSMNAIKGQDVHSKVKG